MRHRDASSRPGSMRQDAMKITVKTAGLLGKYLPPGHSTNQAEIDVPDETTPDGVIEHLGMPAEANYLVALNGTVVPKAQRGQRMLSENDKLSIMPPLKGG